MIVNLVCMFLILFINDIIDLLFTDTFSEIYKYVTSLESSVYQISDEGVIWVLGILTGVAFLIYLAGLYFAFRDRTVAKTLLSIGLFLFIISGIYESTYSLINIDYAPSLAIRYLWYIFSSSLITILYLEDFGLLKKSN